jgi:hypothetical protein
LAIADWGCRFTIADWIADCRRRSRAAIHSPIDSLNQKTSIQSAIVNPNQHSSIANPIANRQSELTFFNRHSRESTVCNLHSAIGFLLTFREVRRITKHIHRTALHPEGS